MVESGRLPRVGGVTGIAAGSKTPIVLVVCLMAGITFSRCTFECATLMALTAFNGEVCTCEDEDGILMVKRGGCPSIRRVAQAAISTQLTRVSIVLLVA